MDGFLYAAVVIGVALVAGLSGLRPGKRQRALMLLAVALASVWYLYA